MNQRLINEHTFKLSWELVGIIEPCLRQEERRDAFEEFYRVVKAGILAYEAEAERMLQRLKPGRN
jgi:hypothetical protein